MKCGEPKNEHCWKKFFIIFTTKVSFDSLRVLLSVTCKSRVVFNCRLKLLVSMHEVDDTNLDFSEILFIQTFSTDTPTSYSSFFYHANCLHNSWLLHIFHFFKKCFFTSRRVDKKFKHFRLTDCPGKCAGLLFFSCCCMYELQLTVRKISLNLLFSEEFF